MGKTIKGKDKAKAKVAKAKRKVARKTKRGSFAAIVAAFALAVLCCGCATSDSAQPAKSQTQNNRFDDCVFVMAQRATVSNGVVVATGDTSNALEMFTQTQSLESTGSTDSYAPTATLTPTTDVKPDLNVNYAQGGGITNRGNGGGATGAAGVLEKLLGSLTDEGLAALKSALANKTNGKITLKKKDGTTTTATCADGACTFEDGTTVTAEDCANCSPD